MSEAFQIRLAQDLDANFILNSWMKSYRKSPFARFVGEYSYATNHHALMLKTITRSRVLCAVSKDDDNQILGWVCIEPGESECLHYIYVKHTFRDLGIAHALLSNGLTKDFTFSHLAEHGLGRHLFQVSKYDPYRFLTGGQK